MKFITAQPDSDYYIWQLDVQMNNFRRLGIERDAIIIFAYRGSPNPNALKFENRTEADVWFLLDERKSDQYIPSVRPHVLKKLFRYMPELSEFMYMDCDAIFTRLPDFKSMESGLVHVSDARSYLDSSYLKSKGEGLFVGMCQAAGISPSKVISQDANTGGAQYVFKVRPGAGFWSEVERTSVKLFDYMEATATIYSPQAPVQSWTADMWAILWTLWQEGKATRISPQLSFAWATSKIEDLAGVNILHNAGATAERGDLFFKGAFIDKSPFGCNFDHVSPAYCSRAYVSEIIDTSESLRP